MFLLQIQILTSSDNNDRIKAFFHGADLDFDRSCIIWVACRMAFRNPAILKLNANNTNYAPAYAKVA